MIHTCILYVGVERGVTGIQKTLVLLVFFLLRGIQRSEYSTHMHVHGVCVYIIKQTLSTHETVTNFVQGHYNNVA